MFCKRVGFGIYLTFFIATTLVETKESFYDLLGVSQDATVREIRQAFKKLALIHHPDKNQNDPEAHGIFLKINRAYEVLKDEELRKVYDLRGEEGLDPSKGGKNYQSWNYYNENFGIYDDDPEIITLSSSDFENSVEQSSDVWFINYYSPMCSHCHELAPAWRRLAKELLGVIRIGAVNCEEDWSICSKQNIHSYPSLVLYPQSFQKRKYEGMRDRESMVDFVLKTLNPTIIILTPPVFEEYLSNKHLVSRPILLIACQDIYSCPEFSVQAKLSLALDGMVTVMAVSCELAGDVCRTLEFYADGAMYYPPNHFGKEPGMFISDEDPQEIFKKILSFLPDIESLSLEDFQLMRVTLLTKHQMPWLVYFYQDVEDPEFKKLHSLLSRTRLRKVNCANEDGLVRLCQLLKVHKFPTFILFKGDDKYEIHYGRAAVHDVANFAKESSQASNFQSLSEDTLENLKDQGVFVVDFFTPWCPPCLKFIPEFRKASKKAPDGLEFGTVDCTQHPSLCRSHNIDSYPSTVVFNNSATHKTTGYHSASHILDFIKDLMYPSVIKVDQDIWREEIMETPRTNLWLVDFFAPWCWHCQQFSPELRKLARELKSVPEVHIGEVDCTIETNLCRSQGVSSYPTIRLYRMGRQAPEDEDFISYEGHRNAATLKMWIMDHLPSLVEVLTSRNFHKLTYDSDMPWIIDFYSPRCYHCVEYAPEFELIAKELDGEAKCGKVNCETYPSLCSQHDIHSYPSVLFFWSRVQRSGIKMPNRQMKAVLQFTKEKIAKFKGSRLTDEL